MMTTEGITKQAVRACVESFINTRLQAKLDKLKPDEHDARGKLEREYEYDAWLSSAARRVTQIQLATHVVKPHHPDARGTNLYEVPPDVADTFPGLVGTFSVGRDRVDDVVGNAAALDVYKLLLLTVEGCTLLDLARRGSASFKQALCDDALSADEMCSAFASMVRSDRSPSSHTLAKQVYFPLSDGGYHLLAPLFPTSLVHKAQATMREDRFGEAARAARAARAAGEVHQNGCREYPNLAIRKLGGTKPQNISQLNSERYGENWLLASMPPVWKSPDARAPLSAESVFPSAFGRQRSVRDMTRQLSEFLRSTSYNNLAIRERRASLVEQICDAVLDYAERLRALPAGWSAGDECLLHEAERLWLDPLRAREDEAFRHARTTRDWPAEVSHRFGNWLNGALSTADFALGDAEHAHWSGLLSQELAALLDVMEDTRD